MRKQAVEQPDVCPRRNGQVQVRDLAGGGAARIDYDDLELRTPLLLVCDSLEQYRMAPGSVGADQDDQVREVQILIAGRNDIFPKGALVSRDRRSHAQPRIRVDVGAADVALHQLVGDVVVLGEKLSGDVKGNRIRTMLGDDSGKALADCL